MTTVRWNRSEDGYVTSKDGRWSIDAQWCGGTTAAFYKLRCPDGQYAVGMFNTQREAKDEADRLASREEVQ